jgi:hypothetical protein
MSTTTVHHITATDQYTTIEVTCLDGRVLKVWIADLMGHTCVDINSTRGREVEPISENTGDPTRAPMGLFYWRNGHRGKPTAEPGCLPTFEPVEGSVGWPAVGTVSLVWDKP